MVPIQARLALARKACRLIYRVLGTQHPTHSSDAARRSSLLTARQGLRTLQRSGVLGLAGPTDSRSTSLTGSWMAFEAPLETPVMMSSSSRAASAPIA